MNYGFADPQYGQHFYWQEPIPIRVDPLDHQRFETFQMHFTSEQAMRLLLGLDQQQQTPEEKEMGSFHNPDAQELAREILSDKNKTALRERIEEAVAHLQELIAGTECGATMTFMKTNDKGQHYFYAVVKNGDKWYTTAQNPRVCDGDDALIEWLVGLEIWEAPQLEITPSSHAALLAGEPIESTATES